MSADHIRFLHIRLVTKFSRKKIPEANRSYIPKYSFRHFNLNHFRNFFSGIFVATEWSKKKICSSDIEENSHEFLDFLIHPLWSYTFGKWRAFILFFTQEILGIVNCFIAENGSNNIYIH